MMTRISSIRYRQLSGNSEHTSTHLAHLQIPLRQLFEHVLRTKSVVQLQLEILHLDLCVLQLRLGQLTAIWSQLQSPRTQLGSLASSSCELSSFSISASFDLYSRSASLETSRNLAVSLAPFQTVPHGSPDESLFQPLIVLLQLYIRQRSASTLIFSHRLFIFGFSSASFFSAALTDTHHSLLSGPPPPSPARPPVLPASAPHSRPLPPFLQPPPDLAQPSRADHWPPPRGIPNACSPSAGLSAPAGWIIWRPAVLEIWLDVSYRCSN